MLLHRADGPGGEEVDLWARDDAAEEAAQKLQMLYGHGAERRHYEDLLKMKPRGRIPTSRIITLKAEEVMSDLLSFITGLKHNSCIRPRELSKVQ